MKFKELRQLTSNNSSDIKILREVLHELSFRRKRKKNVELSKSIEELISTYIDDSFKWPSTAVMSSENALASTNYEYAEGILSFLGYKVGMNGEYKSVRFGILDYTYNQKLPQVNSEIYMRSWGSPKSGTRLKRIAYSLATFYRHAVGRSQNADMTEACNDWDADLEYLRNKYYVGRYDFEWPS